MNDLVIGALAAAFSIFFFGSFAVPIKAPTIVAANIDPFIFQSYKSFTCFATAWLVLIYTPFKFTWWGLAGALIWAITGVAAIIAVQGTGIGLAQSLWSGLSIVVSYIWGAYFFKEPIKNHGLSILALFIMVVGMLGIGVAVSPREEVSPKTHLAKLEDYEEYGGTEGDQVSTPLIVDSLVEVGEPLKNVDRFQMYLTNNEFVKGILCATLVGILNGSFMIPLAYAKKDITGIEYLISFGVGAMSMSILVLGVYSIFQIYLGKACPSFQFRIAPGPALLTGLFWSAGNFFSIYATLYLGLALGWPLVQCQLLVSAMWSVFYYQEVRSYQAAVLLILSSILVVIGAVMLSIFGTVG